MNSLAEATHLSKVDASDLRRAMGRFVTGVGVVLSEDDGVPQGATINSLTWISLDPPLILISLAEMSSISSAVTNSGKFTVSLLSSHQKHIAERFAKKAEGKFDGLPIHRGESGVPIVPGSLATLECGIEKKVEAGDHIIYIGYVTSVNYLEGKPLAFYSGRFGDFIEHDADLDIWL